MLASANAHLAAMTRDGSTLAFDLKGHVPLDFTLAHIDRCTPTAGGKPIKAYRKDASLSHFRLNDHAATIELRCRVP
jgi:hypothetical protein